MSGLWPAVLTRAKRKKSQTKHRRLGAGLIPEHLEPRVLMHGSPQLEAEHAAVMALVDYAAVTHTAVRSGDWNNAATWDHGIPGEGANVLIPIGANVRVDSVQSQGELRTVRVDGKLEFAPTVNTLLMVDTLVVDPRGTLQIGTAANPIAAHVTAQIIVADRGPIDTAWDPRLFSRGIVSHGTVSMFGADTTSFVELAQQPRAGNTQLLLAETPIGWEAGDRLVLTGADSYGKQDEALVIRSISGRTVTLTTALKYDHMPPRVGLSVYVGNTTRNIRISSETIADITRRGHVMFMHAPSVQIHDAEFFELGRTNKLKRLDNALVDINGVLVPGTGTNQVGRYSVHFHRTGVEHGSSAAVIEGSSVSGDPGWAMVNHSSHVDMLGNIVYDVVGAAFVTEVGDEVGSFRGNIAIHSEGSSDSIRSRENIDDFGHQGHGFWFQGAGVAVTDNVAAGHSSGAFVYFTRGLRQDGVVATFDADNLFDRTLAGGKDTIAVGDVPIREFRDNVAFSSDGGFETWFHMRDARHAGRSIVENLTTWNSDLHGAKLYYTNQLTIKNSTLLGDDAIAGTHGIVVNVDTRNLVFENLEVERWEVGIEMPEDGVNVVSGGVLNNVTGLLVPPAKTAARSIEVRDVIFGTLDAASLAGRTQQPLAVSVSVNLANPDLPAIFDANDLRLGKVLFLSKQIYLPEQATSFVPFASGAAPAHVPAQLVGRTNQQLFDQYGLAVGGVLAPASAIFDSRVNALLGPATNPLPFLKLTSPDTVNKLSGYRLKYMDASGRRFKERTATPLVPGWNLISRNIDGDVRTFLVLANVGSSSLIAESPNAGIEPSLPTVLESGAMTQSKRRRK